MRTKIGSVVLAALVVVLGACGSDDDNEPVQTGDGTTDASDAAASPGELPDRAPDAAGTLLVLDGGGFQLETDDSYFQDASLSFNDDSVLVDAADQPITTSDLTDGTDVEVWTDACAESFPVQCTVEALRAIT
jgi:hypothetical protein